MTIEAPEAKAQKIELLSLEELRERSLDRLEDAKVLHRAGRFDAAYYLLGYVVEIALKRQICITLEWEGYPFSRKEFENYTSFKTHDLEHLLHLSGVEKKVKKELLWAWSKFEVWKPEVRYICPGLTKEKIAEMLTSAEALAEALLAGL